MRKKVVLAFIYLFWGMLFILAWLKMTFEARFALVNLVRGHFKFLIEAFGAWKSGNMSLEQVLIVQRIMGVLFTVSIGLILIMIGISFIVPKLKLPGIHVVFISIFCFSFCYQIWVSVKYVALSGLFGTIVYGLVLYYALFIKKREVGRIQNNEYPIRKEIKVGFYILLILLAILSLLPLIINMRLPEGVAIVQ